MIIQPPSPLHVVIAAMRVPFQPEPIPALTKTPDRVDGHALDPWDFDVYRSPLDGMIGELTRRLSAEAERLRRLLPPAPAGSHWVGEIGQYEPMSMSPTSTFQIRYRLVEDGAES